MEKFYPVTPQLRRVNKEVFAPFFKDGEAKSDDLFYDRLARMASGEGIEELLKFDRSLRESRKYDKSFAARALKFLRSSHEITPEDLKSGLVIPDDVVPGSEIWHHFMLLRRLTGAESPAPDATEEALGVPTANIDDATSCGQDWSEIAGQMQRLLASLSAADVVVAGRLAELAEGLVAACEYAEKDRETEERAARLLADLKLLLADRELSMVDLLLEEDVAARFEALIDECKATADESSRLAEALEEVHSKFLLAANSSNANSDLNEVHRLRETAKEKSEIAERLHEGAMAALELAADSILGPNGGTDPISSSSHEHDVENNLICEDPAEQASNNEPDDFVEVESPQNDTAQVIEPVVEPEVSQCEGGVQTDEHSAVLKQEHSTPDLLAATETTPDVKPVPVSDPAAATARPVPRLPETASPVRVLDRLVALLKSGDVALAWHLLQLVSERGGVVPLPADLLRAVVQLGNVTRSEEMLREETLALAGGAGDALSVAEDREAAAYLALAALLIPAFFDPNMGTRKRIADLDRSESLAAFSPLIDELAALSHDVNPTLRQLMDLSDRQPRLARPAVIEELRSWHEAALQRKTVHQPTYRIFHQELRVEEALGSVISDAIHSPETATQSVQDLLGVLGDERAALEAFVRQAEIRSGRPRRDPIEGMALSWFCERLAELRNLLKEWLDAGEQDNRQADDRQRETLNRARNALLKAIRSLELEDSVASTESKLASAARMVLVTRIGFLRQLLEDASQHRPARMGAQLLQSELLRLPGGCQDWTGGDESFAEEREQAAERRLLALLDASQVASDMREALPLRISEGAILAARQIQELLTSQSPTEETRIELKIHVQQIDLREDDEWRKARGRIDNGLRQALAGLSNLDPERAGEIDIALAQLGAITDALNGDDRTIPAVNGVRNLLVPPDYPELGFLLDRLDSNLDALRHDVRAYQRRQIEGILRDGVAGVADDALRMLDRLDQLDPVTVDDCIAELRAGRSLDKLEAPNSDIFDSFFPDFVSKIDTADKSAIARGPIFQAILDSTSAGPLDFSGVDDIQRAAARGLIETWAAFENAMKKSKPTQINEAVVGIFERLGFTQVRINQQRDLVPGRMRSAELNCDVTKSERWFVPPTFGSEANGRYRVLIVRSEVSVDQIIRQIGSVAPDDPWIIFYFGRLSVSDRRRLGSEIRREARKALFLDETLLYQIATSPADPLETFFACSVPFSWQQPYSTNPANIPPEIFFGRVAERRMISDRTNDGCLIYGGRQLGKSALLNHIRRNVHAPERGVIAVYLDIKPIGEKGRGPEQIWAELSHKLQTEAAFRSIGASRDQVITEIETWLSEDRGRRLLAMFDETDNFLRAEHASGYDNLNRLKGLMSGSDYRFKAVFAGLHNVRRLAQAPNSPLPHLGTPLPIGPMNQSEKDRTELRRLVNDPLQSAGFQFADPQLGADLLARVNHYPSLVQVFGKQLVESRGRRAQSQADGPRWTLDREKLFEGELFEKIARQIRDRFQLTLNLDARYECIAKSMALHRLDRVSGESDVLSRGLPVNQIKQLVIWPGHVTEPEFDDLEALLDEMVDLGVLQKLPGGFGLRSAQIAQILGVREDLERDLLNLSAHENEPPFYDAGQYHRLLRPHAPTQRNPFSDRVTDAIFNRARPGLRVIVGRPALVGKGFSKQMQVVAKCWGDDVGEVMISSADAKEIGSKMRRAGATRGVIVIEGAWSLKTAREIARATNVMEGQILPLWCVSQGVEIDEGMLEHIVRPWGDVMLRHWLEEEGLANRHDTPSMREAILAATGGLPPQFELLRGALSEAGTDVEEIKERGTALSLSPIDLGLTEEHRTVARQVSELPGLSVAELAEFLEDRISVEALRRIVGDLRDVGCLIEAPSGSESVLSLSATGSALIK